MGSSLFLQTGTSAKEARRIHLKALSYFSTFLDSTFDTCGQEDAHVILLVSWNVLT